jgi:hypothetical protein
MRFDPEFIDEFQALIRDASARVLDEPPDPEGYRRLLQMRAFPRIPAFPRLTPTRCSLPVRRSDPHTSR